MSKETNCQRYFALSKKMHKDVKRHCGICRQHGMLVETRGHHCNRKNCNCTRCFLIRQRRQIMSTQIRIRRAQDKIFQRTSELTQATIIPQNCSDQNETATCNFKSAIKTTTITQNQCYICQKCKNHGILVWKKARYMPISLNLFTNSNRPSGFANLNKQLARQTYEQKIAETLIPQSKSSSFTLLTRSQPSQTNISIVTFDESTEPDTISPSILVYPIPLRPQSFLLSVDTVNLPTMCSLYNSTGALLNTLATI
ncbi:hypothetical protein X798_04088 [Onchocerca flexuosa]|uniref:DM domain-containing protein n=2 Tax=Onchocerca flexuosa TaxID=387005 RepID=A0A183GYG4_9BILA|nr:hypothetical protein X798_04088 [Onchocerca flexuosa]VDO25216.1 unnamed protein product [Onchocerca flexuosa]